MLDFNDFKMFQLKISTKKKGKHGRFFSINEMADSPVKKTTTSSASDDSQNSQSIPSTSAVPEESCKDSETVVEKDASSPLNTNKPESLDGNLERIQLNCGLPDLIPQQEHIRNEGSSPEEACVKIENTPPLSSKAVKVTVTADSNEDFAGAIISIPNSETPKKNSEKEFTISSWMESANLTPQKTAPTAVQEIGAEASDGCTGLSGRDSISSDLLAKAVREAMISHSDVSMSMDSSQFGEKAQHPLKSSNSKQDLGFNKQNFSESMTDITTSQIANKKQLNTTASPADRQKNKAGEKRRIVPKPVTEDTSCASPAFSMSSVDNVGFLRSPSDSNQIIAYTNSPAFHNDQSSLSGKQVSPNPKTLPRESIDPTGIQSSSKGATSPARTVISSVVGFGPEDPAFASPSDGQGSNQSQEKRKTTQAALSFAWTR